ncbi:RNA polymerase sigma factor [Pseudoclavibacter endophyticus]|uniref:RNA polymerase sigma factor n=1 Tax=Pseudoclavibacter endophyticus TaxID=1778590 RepID=A0A6H9WPZ6_9MICO|nr:RNA polymerase sigma factor [Pseudoclavibacter endophyticus]KAB1649067.1 RNA polymerase sigma factor [Pseudoclavibacter endophyticus]GGA65733.1 RNA polymerase sigma factor [Pseudoclavibacter endophyticus]
MTDAHRADPRHPDAVSARRAVEAVWRIESSHIVATLTRYTGDFSLAEDLAQEALAEALGQWPVQGTPRNAAAWLTAVAKRRAIDHWRRSERFSDRIATLARDVEREHEQRIQGDTAPWDPDEIRDDTLRLVFTACHPVLSPTSRVALTLRVVAGLSTDEIARAFLVPVSAVQQRIVRAKRALADAGVPFETPPPADRPERLGAVLGTIYGLFTEGHAATAGDDWMRPDLASEAVRLARVLARLQPGEPEVHGLLALLELTAARFPARTDAAGVPVLLGDQDRRRWDRGAISRGRAALRRAEGAGRGLGPYGLQAAIAECHAVAPSVDDTDWSRIVRLYDGLVRVAPTPVVALNRAVAVSMADGPDAALAIVDGLASERAFAMSHLLPSVRGELLARLGRDDEARDAFARAAELSRNARERAVLLAKAAART